MQNFIDWLATNRSQKKLTIFWDIETLQYNQAAGRVRPTKYKNVTFSVEIGYFNDDELELVNYPNFKGLFNAIIKGFTAPTGKIYRKTPTIELIAHNNNRYDNHFLLHDLLYYYPEMERFNLYQKNALFENDLTAKKKQLERNQLFQGVVLEKRVKSKTNLDLEFFLESIHFVTTDNWVKTNLSIASLGKKLYNLNLLSEDDLKTDFDYLKYNLDEDLTEPEAHRYAQQVNAGLDASQMKYIQNDIVILAHAVKYYSVIFKGFDYQKITFTSNILEFYKVNNLTSFQLLNEIKDGKKTQKINYTDYFFAGKNFYDYLKNYYAGGLNFYNQKYLARTITDPMFNIDLNSSYPYAMYAFKIPFELKEFFSYQTGHRVKFVDNDDFYLYEIEKCEFDNILNGVKSRVLTQMLVKYYNGKDRIYLNSNTLRIIEKIGKCKVDSFVCRSYLCYSCVSFGAKQQIAEKYQVKMVGKAKKHLIMHDVFNFEETDEPNKTKFNNEEILNAKVLLNGLYGIPALRAYFNLFLLEPDQTIRNYPNGFENTQRNILFSVYITSVALLNLLSPLAHLTQCEIDENFVYCDTDSLYLKKAIKAKLPAGLVDTYALGKWKVEHNEINHFYVLNHKKYCYQNGDNIEIRCGGVPLDAFNTNMNFDEFVNTQFHAGAKISNNKGIVNEQGTVSIYPSITELDKGNNYPMYAEDVYYKQALENMFEKIRAEEINESDGLYIESSLGSFSLADIYPAQHEIVGKDELTYYHDKNKLFCQTLRRSEKCIN